MGPAVTALADRARAAGVVREDFQPSDIPLIYLMLGTVVDFSRGFEDGLYRRYLAILLEGIRTSGQPNPFELAPDGSTKHRTSIGADAYVSSDTVFVAPVRMGDGAQTGAGSVVTRNVKAGELVYGVPARRAGAAKKRAVKKRAVKKKAPAKRKPAKKKRGGSEEGGEASGQEKGEQGLMEFAEKRHLVLYSGSSHPELSEEVAKHLGVKLGEVDIHHFANSEVYVRFLQSVRGAYVFVLQTHTPPVNEHMIETLVMIDALKRGSARRITAVLPFFPYSRQDKKHLAREPISAKLMADLLHTAGADRVMSVDLHAGQIQGFFDVPFDHLTAHPLILDYLRQRDRSTTS